MKHINKGKYNLSDLVKHDDKIGDETKEYDIEIPNLNPNDNKSSLIKFIKGANEEEGVKYR